MRTHFATLFLLLFAIWMPARAQQAIFGGAQIVSPEVHPDHTVTFRLRAPNADSVQVAGDFLPSVKVTTPMGEMDAPGRAHMVKDAEGVWSYTTDPVAPELHGYSFVVDGLTIADPNNPFLMRDVGSASTFFLVGGGHADLYRTMDVPHGTVARRWYDSPGLGMDRRLTVYTPPGYESSSASYPVLYLLHGAGGDEEAWLALGRAAQIMDNLIARGDAEPMIVVMPNGNVIQDAAPGEGSDGYYRPQFMIPRTMDGTFEAHFMEIVGFVEDHYRVRADRAHRAIAGLSMGGFHTMHISRHYPNTFDYIGLFSAALLDREDATGQVYTNIEETLKAQQANGYALYWVAIGKTDFLYDANAAFRGRLDRLGLEHVYVESEGGHSWTNWRNYLSEFVPLLFR